MNQWYSKDISDILEFLQTQSGGLSTLEAEERLKQTGKNELKENKGKSSVLMFLQQFKDVMIIILLIAAIISGFLGDFTDTIVIIVIVLLNAIYADGNGSEF